MATSKTISIAAVTSRAKRKCVAFAPERVIFAPRTGPISIWRGIVWPISFLDTLPYNAHTTASDALWMGLPLVTCPRNAFPGRVATSLLHAIRHARAGDASLADYDIGR